MPATDGVPSRRVAQDAPGFRSVKAVPQALLREVKSFFGSRQLDVAVKDDWVLRELKT
jgi:hypothetical protein